MKITSFAKQKQMPLGLDDLVLVQKNSWKWFLERGLRELFFEVSPILDYTGKDLELWFIDFALGAPKDDERHAKEFGLSYEAALRAKLKLVNKRTGEVKEQEVYLGDLPLMTDRGTFIVNGVERVVVSQLMRSPGVFFTATSWRGRKLFGAKVIPTRGAWMEFETDPAGVIGVRIDRKRRVPVTTFLKALGVPEIEAGTPEREVLERLFGEIDSGDMRYIVETLKSDPAKNRDEALVETYRRLRPGDLATVDNARSLIEAMFFNFDRYDLGEVGRFKLEQRLSLGRMVREVEASAQLEDFAADRGKRILHIDDVVRIIREIIRLNNDSHAIPDDIDHLGNRRIKTCGELLRERLRIGLRRMERIIKDRMSTLDVFTLTPAQLINARPLMVQIREFFTSGQLAQFMNQVNPLSELEHKRRFSAMGPGGLTKERAGFEVRDVHPSHYGRICPIQTPEGPNIGLVGQLALYAKVNELGFIITPYIKVVKGKITKEVVWLDAWEEARHTIAHANVPSDAEGKILGEKVEARIKGEPGLAAPEDVDFMDVAPQQPFSVATSLIPFLEHDDANRALMGSNMQRQAVSSLRPQAPLVSTGIEEKAAQDSGLVVVNAQDGVVASVDANHVVVRPESVGRSIGEERIYYLQKFIRSNDYTAINQKPIVQLGQEVKKGDVLADASSTDQGVLALGQNVLCAFLSWGGYNFEDAIVLSERLVHGDRYTSIHIEDYSIDVRDTKLGPEVTTRDIPNVGEERLKNLDEDGIVRIGAEVTSLDILVGKISPKGEAELTAEERLLRAIFGEKAREVKDTSLRLPHGKHGRVVGIRIFDREKGDKLPPGVIKTIQVEVAQLRKVQVGDKLAGRHGNKGVIARILPVEDMPHLADGTPIDIILSPLGVPSRMNLGQILETHLGWAAGALGYRAVTPVLSGATEQEIKAELRKAGLPEDGKVELYDGRSGEQFRDRVTVGQIYVMKLNHLVEDKIHMRSIGPYSLITQQPLGGKAQFGGQRFGEMEVWALEGYGAAYTLQEMLTIKSDDVMGRAAAYDAIIRGEEIKAPNVPEAFNVMVSEIKALGLSVELLSEEEAEEEK
ncbi:MAG: DNA-directed RNA polymerase subunit beta [bacterium]|nr:DNA-directed RNA polymerase subunit beta [bacterium]